MKRKMENMQKIIFKKLEKTKQKHFYHFFERSEAEFAEISSKINAGTIYEMPKMFRNKRFLNKCNKIVILIAIKNKNV